MTEGTGGEGWRHRGGVCLDEGYGVWGRASRGLCTAVGKLSGSERVGPGGVGGSGLWALGVRAHRVGMEVGLWLEQ